MTPRREALLPALVLVLMGAGFLAFPFQLSTLVGRLHASIALFHALLATVAVFRASIGARVAPAPCWPVPSWRSSDAEVGVRSMSGRGRYHLNIAGDVYVEDACCTNCGLPQAHAPDLFGEGPEQCYVRKQPAGSTELARMLEILYYQELGCIRYGGRSLDVIKTVDGWRDTLDIIDAPGWLRALARALGHEITTNVTSPRHEEPR